MRSAIGVSPAAEGIERPRLFRALERVFPVEFHFRDPGDLQGLDGAIAIGEIGAEEAEALARRLPAFVALAPPASAQRAATGGRLDLAESPLVDRRLRGRSLTVAGLDAAAVTDDRFGEALAGSGDAALWRARTDGGHRLDAVACAPADLAPNEALRDRLSGEASAFLLPLVHFLRLVTGYDAWRMPRPHAAFVVDDPNLHWPTYGFIRFAELRDHARRHGYHVAMATIPLDAWLADPRTARLFRESPDVLSLAVHGNDHVHRELASSLSFEQQLMVYTQALRRVGRLERRARVAVSPVMVPPHGSSRYEALEPMLAAGFEAFCRDRGWWSDWPAEQIAVAGWGPADPSGNGLPILMRHHLAQADTRTEIALSAFLDQPLILYGHHDDFSDGYASLAEAAAWADSFGDVAWSDLGRIARSCFATRTDGTVLRVRLWGRRASVPVPPGTETVAVELPLDYPGSEDDRVRCGSTFSTSAALTFAVDGASPVEIVVSRAAALDGRSVPDRGFEVRAFVRRTATEARDRLRPTLARSGVDGYVRRLEQRLRTER